VTTHFHVGIVVADVEAAQRHLTELLGVGWTPIDDSLCPVDDGVERRLVPLRATYSTAAPYLELIEEVPGTVWVTNEYSNLHHLGFWSTDLGADVARFEARGCPLAMAGYTPRRPPPAVYAYHDDPIGVRLELVTERWRPVLDASIAAVIAADTSAGRHA
jgi:catechol 2,3-dioxygenase-like lactoylglutathione lyase family enzyme